MSCGIYAGPHREAINGEILDIIDGLLREKIRPRDPPAGSSQRAPTFRELREAQARRTTEATTIDVARGQFFREVIVPELEQVCKNRLAK